MSVKHWLIGILFLYSPIALFAQNPCQLKMQIQILDQQKKAIPSVMVQLNGQARYLLSDTQGKLFLPNNCAGNTQLRLSLMGYKTQNMVFTLKADTALTIVLEPDVIHIEDITVNANTNTSYSISKYTLNKQALQIQKGKLLADALQEIAGVTTLKNGSTIVKPMIHGLHSQRILMMNHGVRQEGQQWGAEHAPEIDPFTADQLQVIKGAQGVRYGADALAGVIIVAADSIKHDAAIGGTVDLIGNSNGRGVISHAKLEGGVAAIPGLGWRIQASGKKAGSYKTADYVLGNTGVNEVNYAATLQYNVGKSKMEAYYSHFGSELGIFSGAHVGTVEDIQARIANGRPFETYDFTYAIQAPKQRVSHDLLKLNWKYAINAMQSIELQYAFQQNNRREYDLRRVESDDTPMADMALQTQTFDAIYTHRNSSIGAQAMMQVNNNRPGTGTTPIIPNYDNLTLGLFAIQQFHWRQFHFDVGGRYDYRKVDVAGYRYDYKNPNENGSLNQYLMTDQKFFHNASGTVGMQYHISPNLHWKSNVGLAWRAPSANELYSDGVHHGSGTYEVGRNDLNPEKGLKWINTLNYSVGNFQASMDIYGQWIYGYIYAQAQPDSVRQTIRGTFPLFSYQQHDAQFYGTDIQLSYSFLSKLNYKAALSMVRAKNRTTGAYLPDIPSDRFKHSLQWFPYGNHKERTYLQLTHRLVAQQNRYSPGTDYAAPPAGYQLIDLDAATSLNWGKQELLLSVHVDNLFNRSYKDYMDRFRYYAHQPGRNVNLKITYNF